MRDGTGRQSPNFVQMALIAGDQILSGVETNGRESLALLEVLDQRADGGGEVDVLLRILRRKRPQLRRGEISGPTDTPSLECPGETLRRAHAQADRMKRVSP